MSLPHAMVASITWRIVGSACSTPRMVSARRLVAYDEGVGLRAVEEAERDAGEGGMEQRALALDDIPMLGVGVGRQPFGRARDEVGDDGIDRHAPAGDEDAGLPGGAEVRVEALRPHLPFERQGRVLLANGAVGADREQPLAPALRALAGFEAHARDAHIVELAAVLASRIGDLRNVLEPLVEPGRDVHSRLERGDDRPRPMVRQHATGVDDADDHRVGAACPPLLDRDVLEAEVCLAAGQAQLPDAPVPAPVDDARRGLGGKLVLNIADEHQIGLFDLHVAGRVLHSRVWERFSMSDSDSAARPVRAYTSRFERHE